MNVYLTEAENSQIFTMLMLARHTFDICITIPILAPDTKYLSFLAETHLYMEIISSFF